jgi:hypothetical protein
MKSEWGNWNVDNEHVISELLGFLISIKVVTEKISDEVYYNVLEMVNEQCREGDRWHSDMYYDIYND